jgi:hypothetical protein
MRLQHPQSYPLTRTQAIRIVLWKSAIGFLHKDLWEYIVIFASSEIENLGEYESGRNVAVNLK